MSGLSPVTVLGYLSGVGLDYCFGIAIGILTYIIGKDAYGALRQNL